MPFYNISHIIRFIEMAQKVSHIRLGVSKDVLPYHPMEVLEAEYNFSRFLVQSVQNTILGLTVGAAASLFFKRKSIIFYTAGLGFGYTFFNTFKWLVYLQISWWIFIYTCKSNLSLSLLTISPQLWTCFELKFFMSPTYYEIIISRLKFSD